MTEEQRIEEGGAKTYQVLSRLGCVSACLLIGHGGFSGNKNDAD